MPFPAGTQLWVRCDDGVWWPAKVMETDNEMRAFMCDGEDCCVEFYHSRGELYPLLSTEAARVQPFHADAAARTTQEHAWFATAEVKAAVVKALRDQQQQALLHGTASPFPESSPTSTPLSAPPPLVATSFATAPSAAAATKSTPFSAAELRNIHTLLDAVTTDTSARLRQQLQEAQVSVTHRDVQHREQHEREARKRRRPTSSIVRPRNTPLQGAKENTPCVAPSSSTADAASLSDHVNRAVSPSGTSDWEASASDPPSPVVAADSLDAADAANSTAPDESGDEANTIPFVPAAKRRVLEVLRHEVFENAFKFVLSPIYRFEELMGAVVVENASLVTTLPSPHALRERPTDGFSPQRRVLLVPLNEDYEHTSGWMAPLDLDGTQLSMSVFVNDTLVALPAAWSLSPAKEAAAVKTALSVDITDLVLSTDRELFSLQVVFSGEAQEVEMWRGVIACVFAEEVGLARLGERIVSLYRQDRSSASQRSPSHARGDRNVVDITEASIKIQCPITTLPMEIPVRSRWCEHLQCMELAAVLIQCVRQNIWNCPLCNAAMKPDDVWVNYRLKDWLASHPQQVVQVEYVVETAKGTPLKVIYRQAPERSDSVFEVVDVDDC